MTNIADNVLAIETAVTALPDVIKTAIAGLVIPAPVVDETAVLAAIAALSDKVDALTALVNQELADLVPTSAA